VIHLIQVDRDGIMSFACDEVELFTTQGATRDIFRLLMAEGNSGYSQPELLACCPYCVRLLTQRNSKNSGVRR
jgi:hypothetical protein